MWSEAFERFECRWNKESKLEILLDFLDRNDNTVVTPEMFTDWLQAVATEEDKYAREFDEDWEPG
jgi:hypothetical protein